MAKKNDNYQIGSVILHEEALINSQKRKLAKVAEKVNNCIEQLQEEGVMFDDVMFPYLLTDEKHVLNEARRQYKEEFNRTHQGRFKFSEGIDDKAFADRISTILKELRFDVKAYEYSRSIEFVDGKAVVTDYALQKVVSGNEIKLQTPMQVELYKRAKAAADVLNSLLDFTVKHKINYCPLVSYGGIPAVLTIFDGEVKVHEHMIKRALGTTESQEYLRTHNS